MFTVGLMRIMEVLYILEGLSLDLNELVVWHSTISWLFFCWYENHLVIVIITLLLSLKGMVDSTIILT